MSWPKLVKDIPCFVAAVDRDGVVTHANTNLAGKTPKTIVGTKLMSHVHPGDRGVLLGITANVLKKNRCQRVSIRDVDGGPWDVEFGPQKGAYGEVIGMMCVWMRDVSVSRTSHVAPTLPVKEEEPKRPKLRLKMPAEGVAADGKPAPVMARVIPTVQGVVAAKPKPIKREVLKLDYVVVYSEPTLEHAGRLRLVFDWAEKRCGLWPVEEFGSRAKELKHKPRVLFLGKHKYIKFVCGIAKEPMYANLGANWRWAARQAGIWAEDFGGETRMLGDDLQDAVADLYQQAAYRELGEPEKSALPPAKLMATHYLKHLDKVKMGRPSHPKTIRHRQYTLAITTFLLQGLRPFAGLKDRSF